MTWFSEVLELTQEISELLHQINGRLGRIERQLAPPQIAGGPSPPPWSPQQGSQSPPEEMVEASPQFNQQSQQFYPYPHPPPSKAEAPKWR